MLISLVKDMKRDLRAFHDGEIMAKNQSKFNAKMSEFVEFSANTKQLSEKILKVSCAHTKYIFPQNRSWFRWGL